MSTQVSAKLAKKCVVCYVRYMSQLSFHFAHHRCWLGTRTVKEEQAVLHPQVTKDAAKPVQSYVKTLLKKKVFLSLLL